MNKTLGWKLGAVAATLLFFLFGIFGLPKEFSGSGLLASLQDRIKLGLDLKGGTHLILQVQVNDAVNGDSDRAVERLKEDLRSHKINYTEMTRILQLAYLSAWRFADDAAVPAFVADPPGVK